MNNQDQLFKALENYIPADQREVVSKTVDTFLESAVEQLESEYQAKLNEANEGFKNELAEAEKVAEAGYAKAWGIISDLRDRLEILPKELEAQVQEEYKVAYNMIQEEKAKNSALEADLLEYHESQLHKIKEFIVDKLDIFCQENVQKFYETARKDLVNDPTVLEHRLAFDKILDIAGNYLSDEEKAFATTSKVDTINRELETLRGQMKIAEQKNMRLSMENNKLNEAVRSQEKTLLESAQRAEKKNRAERTAKVEGRGSSEVNRTVVIGESTGEERVNKNRQNVEIGDKDKQMFAEWRKLAKIDE